VRLSVKKGAQTDFSATKLHRNPGDRALCTTRFLTLAPPRNSGVVPTRKMLQDSYYAVHPGLDLGFYRFVVTPTMNAYSKGINVPFENDRRGRSGSKR
jgi:hypothetical protein